MRWFVSAAALSDGNPHLKAVQTVSHDETIEGLARILRQDSLPFCFSGSYHWLAGVVKQIVVILPNELHQAQPEWEWQNSDEPTLHQVVHHQHPSLLLLFVSSSKFQFNFGGSSPSSPFVTVQLKWLAIWKIVLKEEWEYQSGGIIFGGVTWIGACGVEYRKLICDDNVLAIRSRRMGRTWTLLLSNTLSSRRCSTRLFASVIAAWSPRLLTLCCVCAWV